MPLSDVSLSPPSFLPSVLPLCLPSFIISSSFYLPNTFPFFLYIFRPPYILSFRSYFPAFYLSYSAPFLKRSFLAFLSPPYLPQQLMPPYPIHAFTFISCFSFSRSHFPHTLLRYLLPSVAKVSYSPDCIYNFLSLGISDLDKT